MKEFKKLSDYIQNIPSRKIVQIPSNQFMQYCGRSVAQYAMEQTVKVMEVLALRMWQKFPNRLDRKLGIGDGCASNGGTGDVKQHTSHAGGWRNDLNYYTLKKNTTQYVPSNLNTNWRTEKGLSKLRVDQEMIWSNPLEGKGLLPVFDAERNLTLCSWIIDIFSYCEILVSSGIYNALKIKVLDVEWFNWRNFEKNIRDTGRTQWDHHLHMHVDFGTSGRPDGLDLDWDKERDWLKCVI
jgi:hypothetical protein